MKRILNNIMLLGMSALLFASCSEELAEEVKQGSASLDGTVLVKVGIGIGGEATTKAMAEQPDIHNLMVAVFDDAGYLTEYKEAKVSEYPIRNGQDGGKTYEVELSVNPDARSIHFIANGPETVKLGSEEDVIGTMVAYANPTESQLGPDLYWQKILLPGGIKYKFGTNGLPEKAEGADGAYVLDDEIANSLANVGLIRNFAKFTIKSMTNDFKLVNAVILNTPDRGYAAPYNRTTGAFVYDYAGQGVKDLADNGYTASVPASIHLEKNYDKTVSADVDGVVTSYMFEREMPTRSSSDEPTFIVVGGYYGTSKDITYYKINLQDYKTDDFYPIFRNFNYTVCLKEVTTAGLPTQEAAAKSAGTGDISVISTYSNLPSISNGLSRIEVETVEKIFVSDLSEFEFPLNYKFIPDLKDLDAAGNAKVNNTYQLVVNGVPSGQMGQFDKYTEGVQIVVGAPGASGAAISDIRVADYDINDQRTIYFKPAAPGETQKVQTISIIGNHVIKDDKGDYFTNITIRREIKIIVRPPFDMASELEPADVMKTVGEPVVLDINLPEGLPASIFPLHMNIEAEKLTLSPNEGRLTVEYGNSIIPESNRRSAYHFVKTINWSDYYIGENTYNTVFPVNLKTNAAISATEVWVTNEYFNPTHTTLANRANAVYATIPSDWYTTYEAADNHVAQGQKTTLTAKAKFVPATGNKVEFKVTLGGNLTTLTGVTDGTKDANGYYTYTADYTPATCGKAIVEVTATDADKNSSTPVTGSFVVWKAVKTKETKKELTALTSSDDLTKFEYVVISNKNYSSTYLAVDNGSLTTVTTNTDTKARWKIAASGSYYSMKNNAGGYLALSRDSYSYSLSGTASIVRIANTNNGWTIRYNGNSTRYFRQTANKSFEVKNDATNAYWTIYGEKDVTTEVTTYVDPTK